MWYFRGAICLFKCRFYVILRDNSMVTMVFLAPVKNLHRAPITTASMLRQNECIIPIFCVRVIKRFQRYTTSESIDVCSFVFSCRSTSVVKVLGVNGTCREFFQEVTWVKGGILTNSCIRGAVVVSQGFQING